MYSVKTKYIVADFGAGKEIYDNIRVQLQSLDVGVLINNVGRMYDYPDDLDNISEELIWQIININVGAVTMMSRAVIPQMKMSRRGIIVNISSGSECQPAPLMTVYASTKVYVKNFTLGWLIDDWERERQGGRNRLEGISVKKGSVICPLILP
jgi:17beta-estradiol 17-dehydrogenase / very-long-chain 3-oxoacyl-CoA reductase